MRGKKWEPCYFQCGMLTRIFSSLGRTLYSVCTVNNEQVTMEKEVVLLLEKFCVTVTLERRTNILRGARNY